jgi:hypothetical protein
MAQRRWVSIAAIAVLIAISAATILPYARVKPFWHDEIYTILLSRLPSIDATWHAEEEGVDLSPPLNLWLTRGVHAVAGSGPIVTRVPAIAGFLLMVFVVFALLHQRAGVVAATTGALLPFLTAGLRYAAEARAYGVMMGLTAAALYCWMEAAEGRRRALHLTLLWAALAGSLWNHYFGVLAFAPIVAGELARAIRRRRLDVGVAVAIAGAVAAALPLIPLLRVGSTQRSAFWAQGAQSQIVDVYRFLLNALLSPRDGIVAALAITIVGGSLLLKRRPVDETRHLPSHEAVAIAVAVATPMLAVLIGRFVVGVFVPRYALGGIVGLSIGVPIALWRYDVRRSPAELLVCAALLYAVGTSAVVAVRTQTRPINPIEDRTLLTSSFQSPGPTVISSSLQFLQYWYYLPPAFATRVCYLADPAQALSRTGSDTIDRGYLALSRWTAVPIQPYQTFLAQHRSFRVYEGGSGWLLDALRDLHARIDLIARSPEGRLYQVTMP